MKSFLLYLIISLVIFYKILFGQGVVMGGDWGLPSSRIQMQEFVDESWFAWTNQGNLIGTTSYFHNNLPIVVYTKICLITGIPPSVYQKIFLIFSFTLMGYSFSLFMKHFKVGSLAATIGGLLYMITPVSFNYSIIGWSYVFLALGTLPLSLLFLFRSVESRNPVEAIKSGLMFFIGMHQAQSIIWFPLFFLSSFFILVNNRKQLTSYIKSLFIVFLVLFSTTTSLWIPLFFGKGSGLETGLGLSTISMGTWERLNPINIVRNWGSLFNYQFEISYIPILTGFSFLMPVLASFSIIFTKNIKRQIFSLIPMIFFVFLNLLGPYKIAKLPFSDIYRDVSRFSVIFTFSYAFLSALLLNFLWKIKKYQFGKYSVAIIFFLWLVCIHPFWTPGVSETNKIQNTDMRLRTFLFPQSYFKVENILLNMEYSKAIYYPWDVVVNSKNDPRFKGNYSEMANVFATYSPAPGMIPVGDKNGLSETNISNELLDLIASGSTSGFKEIIRRLGSDYVVIRKDLFSNSQINDDKLISLLIKTRNFDLIYQSGEIDLYKSVKTNPIFSVGNANNFQYQRNSPSEFEMSITGAKEDIEIILHESYHQGWELRLLPIHPGMFDHLFYKKTSWIINKHTTVDGYANQWSVNLNNVCNNTPSCKKNQDGTYDLKIQAVFRPQNLLNIGYVISFSSFIIYMIIIFKKKYKK